MSKSNSLDVKVEQGRLNALEDAAGALHPKLDEEEFRLLLAHIHAAQRAIVAHADSDSAVFKVKASPSELHVVRDD
jgi:hypothetical protein